MSQDLLFLFYLYIVTGFSFSYAFVNAQKSSKKAPLAFARGEGFTSYALTCK